MIDNIADYPQTIEEAINRLEKEIPLKDQVRINSMDQDDLTDLHFIILAD